MPSTVLHVSPHPDDEILGCGATLLALRDAGWRVVNLVCSLGRPADRARRRAELDAALSLLRFDGVEAGGRHPLSEVVSDVARDVAADLVVSPHPFDGHPTHEAVGRAVAAAGARPGAPRWWSWGLWADLAAPNLYSPWGDDRLGELAAALACHAGELRRNRYEELPAARGRVAAVLGSERVFGYGSTSASPLPYADLLQEQAWRDGAWRSSPPRLLDPGAPCP